MAYNNETNFNRVLGAASTDATGEFSDGDFELFLTNIRKKETETLAAEERIRVAKELISKGFWNKEIENLKKFTEGSAEYNKALERAKERAMIQTVELARKIEDNLYKYSTMHQKAQMAEERRNIAKNGIESLKQKLAEIEASEQHGNKINHQQKKYRIDMLAAGKEATQAEEQRRKIIKATAVDSKTAAEEKRASIIESIELEKKQHKDNIANIDEQLAELEKKKQKAIEDGSNGNFFQEQIDMLEAAKKENEAAIKQNNKESNVAQIVDNAMKSVENVLQQGFAKMERAVDNAMDVLAQYRSGIEARLQGSQSSYDEFSSIMKKSLAVSPMVKQTEVLAKLNDAVDKGIAYNVEQRAFLASVSDKIATTFDAFDSNLLRIIRLQQADTTAARMGLEAQLTQFFNSTFSDTSYLSEGYDQVSAALVDANAQMTRDMSIAFEYNVQKWMGSLAALGFGTDTIQTIATGINYLGSGNVQALAGNTQLQNLLAMSASRAGLSYSEMLVNGIDDSNVNTLLKAMVEYLREIAEDENAVVKAAYGDIFNFSQADLRAIKNIRDDDINNISSQTMSYSTAMSSINEQLSMVYDRLSTAEMIDNVFANFAFTSAESIANNVVGATTYKLLNMIEEFTGGIHLPAISVMGNMVDLSSFTIEGIAKAGIFGISALANVGNLISSVANGGGLDLSEWGFDEYTSRGGDFTPTMKGVQKSVSSSKSVSSASSSDMKKESLSSTEEDQETMKQKSKESGEGQFTVETLYEKMYKDPGVVYTFDRGINKKLENAIPVADSKGREHLNNIYEKLSGTLSVSISGLADLFEGIKPNDVQQVKYVEDGRTVKLSDQFSTLATTLTKVFNGQDSGSNSSDNEYSLANLIKLLMDGSLEVSESNSSDIYDKLVEIEANQG